MIPAVQSMLRGAGVRRMTVAVEVAVARVKTAV
jgi:hypothetical protein